jgi:hypothetical protein
MDRDELEERIRGRRPGDAGFRRGVPVDDPSEVSGYVPFQPEPEDALAAREAGLPDAARHIDNTPPDFDVEPAAPPPHVPPVEPPPEAYSPRTPEPPYAEPPYAEVQSAAPQYAARDYQPDDAEPGYEPEEAYPYAYSRRRDGGSRGGGALPVIGFIALCALALAVGAVLAGVLGGPDEVGQASPTPTVAASSATPQPTPVESAAESASAGASATPEPIDGPVTFPDGAVITVQPCATRDMSFDGCDEDGSTVDGDTWVWIGFDDALGSDEFTLGLRTADETIDQQEITLGEVLDCPNKCSGYLIGAAYRDLDSGEYVLVVRRNGDFADSAEFRVEG